MSFVLKIINEEIQTKLKTYDVILVINLQSPKLMTQYSFNKHMKCLLFTDPLSNISDRYNWLKSPIFCTGNRKKAGGNRSQVYMKDVENIYASYFAQ